MLGKSTHGAKVNFCKFTNETRLAIEDASESSKQTYVCAINGNAAGGGYELALAADHIMTWKVSGQRYCPNPAT